MALENWRSNTMEIFQHFESLDIPRAMRVDQANLNKYRTISYLYFLFQPVYHRHNCININLRFNFSSISLPLTRTGTSSLLQLAQCICICRQPGNRNIINIPVKYKSYWSVLLPCGIESPLKLSELPLVCKKILPRSRSLGEKLLQRSRSLRKKILSSIQFLKW